MKNRDDRWQPLRDFCQRWFTARGEEPPVPITPEGPKPTAAPGADPYKTGLPGKPTIKHLILAQFQERVEQGTFELKLKDEAEALCNWARDKHPNAPRPQPPSIRNAIRDDYRKAKRALQQDNA